MDFRHSVIEAFHQLLSEKVAGLMRQADELKESVAAETKSSVGDKYETGRAMLHLEMEKLNYHLREARDQLTLLQSYHKTPDNLKVTPGNIVLTNKGSFFIAGAFGKVSIEGKSIMAISPLSPLGKKMMGTAVNESIELNAIRYKITGIY